MRLIDADALMQSLGITSMDCGKCAWYDRERSHCKRGGDFEDACCAIENAPTAQPERLTDDDFETIRILLNADKEKLCNQHRWKEAEEYQRIIDKLIAFASAQPEVDCQKCIFYGFPGFKQFQTTQPKKGKWVRIVKHHKDAEQEYSYNEISCSECGAIRKIGWRDARFCPNCGAYMETEYD